MSPLGTQPSSNRLIIALKAALALAIFCALAVSSFAVEQTAPPLLLTIVGDSTVSAYDAKSPIHGWGEYVQARVRSRVRVLNAAVAGASSVSFVAEGHWKAATKERAGVMLIQFGHNDSTQKSGLEPYRTTLKWMVETARAAGTFPILVTPMQRRIFRRTVLTPNLQDYADAMRQVATETGTVLVDLNSLSGQLYTKIGPVKARQLGSTVGDLTHFNATGAQAMAEIIFHELAEMRTPLRLEILAPTAAALSGKPPSTNDPPK
jgi:lysophospholipase L1-like esterase